MSISGYTGSGQAWETGLKWLKTCVMKHGALCPAIFTPAGPPKLPLRVIDIVARESQDVRLVETDGQVGHYACLSHCWGDKQPLRTTLDPDTLSLYKKGIRWGSLPRTFQEAIIVARPFDFQFLWIDSLCILQDDIQDWRVQSALMAEIYRNAVVTIAGSASSGAYQGLFRTADTEHIDVPLQPKTGVEEKGKLRSRKALSQPPNYHYCSVVGCSKSDY